MAGKRWTPAEDTALLATNFTPNTLRYTGESGIAETAERLGRTVHACYHRLRKLLGRVDYWTTEGLWTVEEDARIIAELKSASNCPAPAGTWPALQTELGRSRHAIAVRACKLRKLL